MIGTNDVTVKRKTPTDIADSVISFSRKCKDAGINEVIISSIVCRKISIFQLKLIK